MKVLIMAGGTGGHVFPALTVAQALQQQQITVHWLGTRRGLENELVPKANIPISYTSIGGWRGKGIKKWLAAPFILLRALYQSIRIIKTEQPDVVLGMGGFASGPGGIAAWLLRKPLIIHEQNSIAGLTNRILAYGAKQVLAAFPDAFASRHHALVIGNPVRDEIANLTSPVERLTKNQDNAIHLLIIGGSQGAQAINQIIPQTLTLLAKDERPMIWHQTGKKDLTGAQTNYKNLGLTAQLTPFIDNMAQAYEWADLVLCRAGALTIAELTATGVASILVPYPYAVDNHQLRNAEYLVKQKAAILVSQTELTPARLAELLRKMQKNRQLLLEMAQAARQLYRGDATEQVVACCLRFRKKPPRRQERQVKF